MDELITQSGIAGFLPYIIQFSDLTKGFGEGSSNYTSCVDTELKSTVAYTVRSSGYWDVTPYQTRSIA